MNYFQSVRLLSFGLIIGNAVLSVESVPSPWKPMEPHQADASNNLVFARRLYRRMSSPRCLPRTKNQRTQQRLTGDTYPIGKFDFRMTKKEYGVDRTAFVTCDFLQGLSNFTKIVLRANRPNECMLSWSRLKASCRISNVINGINDGNSEAEVLVRPLRLLVRVRPQSEAPELVRKAEAKRAEVTVRHPDNMSSYTTDELEAEIQKTVLCIVNSEVSNALMGSVKCSGKGSSTGVCNSCIRPKN